MNIVINKTNNNNRNVSTCVSATCYMPFAQVVSCSEQAVTAQVTALKVQQPTDNNNNNGNNDNNDDKCSTFPSGIPLSSDLP